MSKQTGIKANLLTYLAARPGCMFSTEDLMRQLGIIHRGTVHSALGRLREEGHPVEQPTKGVWTYKTTGPVAQPAPPAPAAAPAPASADLLQILHAGADLVVARDELGAVWVLRIIHQEGHAA